MPFAPMGQGETKKHRVLQEAQRDPFLTVVEIATLASTTPKYVRTVLSEAGLSLAALRKAYAQRARASRAGHDQASWTGFDPAGSFSLVGEHVVHGKLMLSKRPDPSVAIRLKADPDSPLLLVDRWAHVAGEPVFLNRIFTPHHVALDPAEVASGQPLRHALGLDEGALRCSEPSVQLGAEPEPEIAAAFGTALNQPLLQWSHIVSDRRGPRGWEVFFFDAERVGLQLPPEAANEVRVVVRDIQDPTAAIS